GIAAIPTHPVAVVAFFARRPDPVAAEGRRAVRVAAVAADHVAIVTRLARRPDAVAAAGRRAVRVASVTIDGIAVVTVFARVENPVPAGGDMAGIADTVAVGVGLVVVGDRGAVVELVGDAVPVGVGRRNDDRLRCTVHSRRAVGVGGAHSVVTLAGA